MSRGQAGRYQHPAPCDQYDNKCIPISLHPFDVREIPCLTDDPWPFVCGMPGIAAFVTLAKMACDNCRSPFQAWHVPRRPGQEWQAVQANSAIERRPLERLP